MDEERLRPNSDFLPNQSGEKGLDNGGDDDRLSELPNEILLLILSLLPVRKAASTTVLSSRWLDLWKQIPNLKFNLESDRISQLPDQIISVVLSFLRLEQAAATSVLSSRWLDSWKHTPNLDFYPRTFDDSREGGCKYTEMVNSILPSLKARSLKLFRICFYVDKSAKQEVTKWLEFVFLRKVESLQLDFCCSEVTHMVVLEETLRELDSIFGDPRTLILFQSLKNLRLGSFELTGEDIELFLHNCPLLEGLMICYVSLKSDINICSPSLKRLGICKWRGGKSVKVTAPNLTFIRFNDGAGKLLFEDVPRLVEADVDINSSKFVKHHFASEASRHISQLQHLKICLPRPKVFWTNEAFPHMPNLKKLVISCFETYNHSLLPVTRLIWASPRLEEFTLEFYRTREASTAYMAETTDVAGRPVHQHLKVFNLLHYNGQGVSDHGVELVAYVSNNCTVLRRIDVSWVPNNHLRHRLRCQVPNHVKLSINRWR